MSDAGAYSQRFGYDFQAHILAVALRYPGFVVRFRSALSHEFFHADVHRLVAKALFDFVDKYGDVPERSTLIEHIRPLTSDAGIANVESTLKGLYADSIRDAEAVIDTTIAFGRQQALLNAIVEGSERIDRNDIEEIPALIEKAQLVGVDILDVGIHYSDLTRDQRAALYHEDEQAIVPTGIPHIDYAMNGGPCRGELCAILAPPKRGKTTALVNIGGGSCALGANVAHYTCEIREIKTARRYDDWIAGPAHPLKFTDTEAYVTAVNDRVSKMIQGQLFIKEYPTRTLTPSMIRSHLSILKSYGFVPDVLVVDYADILKPERRLGEVRHEVAGIYEDLRKLAGQFNCVVWTASQAGRVAVEKSTPELQDFSEAFEKAAIVDAAIGFGQTPEEKRDGLCRLFFAGLRGSEDGSTIHCRIDRNRCRLRTLALYNIDDAQIQTPYDAEDDGEVPDEGAVKVKPRRTKRTLRSSKPRAPSPAAVARERAAKRRGGPRKRKGPSKRVEPK